MSVKKAMTKTTAIRLVRVTGKKSATIRLKRIPPRLCNPTAVHSVDKSRAKPRNDLNWQPNFCGVQSIGNTGGGYLAPVSIKGTSLAPAIRQINTPVNSIIFAGEGVYSGDGGSGSGSGD